MNSINLKVLFQEQWFLGSVLFLALCALILLSYSVRNGSMSYVDQAILTWFHKSRTPYLDHFFSSVTWLGSLWVLIPLYLLFTFLFSTYGEYYEKLLGITFWGSVITTYILKYEIQRHRPHLFTPLYELPLDPSFPSAHSAQIAAFVIGVMLVVVHSALSYQWTMLSVLVVIALLVFASRMYLQVHFPSDVLAGVLVAIIWGIIAFWSVKGGILR